MRIHPKIRAWGVAGALLVFVCLASRRAPADTWLPPKEFDAVSENGRFTARVTPRSAARPPRVEVFPTGGEGRPPLWAAALSNGKAPLEVFVSDDGRCVATFDNWGGAGSGDDVLAFYDQAVQRKKYSLEQLLSSGGIDPEKASYEWSTSSRWWKRGSVTFFDDRDGRPYLCVWLPWAKRWLAWDAASGEPDKLTPGQVGRLDAAGRRRVLKAVEAGEDLVTAAGFLGALALPQDRKVLEGLLRSPTFSRGYTLGSDKDETSFFAFSSVREAADAALAEWDGKRHRFRECVYLGSLRGAVHLPELPKHGEATVRVYLVPQEVTGPKWAASNPVHRLNIDLGWHLAQPILRPHFVGNTIRFRFECVEPGRYWVKVVYDAAPPFCPDEKGACEPGAGDYEGEDLRAVEVTAGKVAEAATVECARKVGGKE